MKKHVEWLVGSFVGIALVASASAEEKKPVDPASNRMIWGPTALPNEKIKKVQLTAFDLGLWTVDYAPNANINVGLQTVPPFGIFVVGGTFRGVYTVAPEVNVGIYGNIGTLGVFSHEDPVTYYGGGPMLTIGTNRRAVNFTVLNYGASHNNDHGFAMLPGMGGSIQVSNRVKLNLEGYAITTPQQHKFLRAGAILYGCRIFSKDGDMFGDISFLAPIYSGAGDFYRYIPMGVPVLAFGFSF